MTTHELHFRGGRWDGLVLEIDRYPWPYMTIGHRETKAGVVCDVEAGDWPRLIEPGDTLYALGTVHEEGETLIGTYWRDRNEPKGATIHFPTP